MLFRSEDIAKKIFGIHHLPEEFRQEKFSGENLHRNFPLESVENENVYGHVFNQVLYKMQLFQRYGLYFRPKITGSLAALNKDYYLKEEKKKTATIRIEKRDLFDFFNTDVMQKFNRIRELNAKF